MHRLAIRPDRPTTVSSWRAAVPLCAALAACAPPVESPAPAGEPLERHEFAQVHMGMPVRIVLYAASDSTARNAARAAFDTIARLDGAMSDYRDDSELRRLESAPPLSWTAVSAPLFDVLARALDFARASDGAFDPTIGPLTALWRDARRDGTVPDPAAIHSARKHVDWTAVELDTTRGAVRLRAGVRFDLGAIAKGYILDAALHALRSRAVDRAFIEAGGDIVAGEPPPDRDGWRIETPGADSAFQAAAHALARAALATSGSAFQYLDAGANRYSHVLDPASGLGITDPSTIHVIAPDGATADALATTLSLIAPERWPALLARYGATAAVARAKAGDPER